MNFKIIHIALGKANPQKQNGVNKVINELIKAQRKQGFEVELWGITNSPNKLIENRDYTYHLFKKKGFLLDQKLVKKIKEIKSPNQVIFHFHGSFTPDLYRVSVLLRQKNIKYIVTPHGAYNEIAIEKGFYKKWLFIHLFEKKYIKNAAFVQLLGASELIGLKKHFKNYNYKIIPNGHHFNISLERKVFHKMHFGYVGRIDVFGKGLKELIQGFQWFIEIHKPKNAKLHIIGNGPDLAMLQQLSSHLKLDDYIVFHGSVFGDEKDALMKELDALILPSRGEGIPGVVLEALSLGVPCIISKETNMGEDVKSFLAGIVIEEINEKEVYEALTKTLRWNDEKRNELSKNAIQLVKEKYNWNVINPLIIDLYESAILA
jgi:glycosyltransferase involved in cell wall biosynthesis